MSTSSAFAVERLAVVGYADSSTAQHPHELPPIYEFGSTEGVAVVVLPPFRVSADGRHITAYSTGTPQDLERFVQDGHATLLNPRLKALPDHALWIDGNSCVQYTARQQMRNHLKAYSLLQALTAKALLAAGDFSGADEHAQRAFSADDSNLIALSVKGAILQTNPAMTEVRKSTLRTLRAVAERKGMAEEFDAMLKLILGEIGAHGQDSIAVRALPTESTGGQPAYHYSNVRDRELLGAPNLHGQSDDSHRTQTPNHRVAPQAVDAYAFIRLMMDKREPIGGPAMRRQLVALSAPALLLFLTSWFSITLIGGAVRGEPWWPQQSEESASSDAALGDAIERANHLVVMSEGASTNKVTLQRTQRRIEEEIKKATTDRKEGKRELRRKLQAVGDSTLDPRMQTSTEINTQEDISPGSVPDEAGHE